VVHRALDAMVRGRRGESLRAFVRALVDVEQRAPADVDRLMALLDAVIASDTWTALNAAGRVQSELPVMRAAQTDAGVQVTHGVMDVAVLGDDGWRVIDWKTDAVTDVGWAQLCAAKYDRQVQTYAQLLHDVTARDARAVLQRVAQR
jgi:ATP-dependent exoDNAse (exonuclease V) beta subunit